ncbi:MAG: NmrA family protein [Flaviaesturariibacter sp.]|nr:NmrA family protein [Flaviaesturariibacter sp.]
MSRDLIVVAGATGNLGGRIAKALRERGAGVRVPVRAETDAGKIEMLHSLGVEVVPVRMDSIDDLAGVCRGASCVVSALQGLGDVIVGVQSVLLHTAIVAGVSRFIPSDFSIDFTKIDSENRNFDLRRAFHKTLAGSPVRATSIFNGAFAEILTYRTPLLQPEAKMAGYWGNKADWHLDFTTMDDTAAFTAAAALDAEAPRSLCIAGFQATPRQLAQWATEITGTQFDARQLGTLEQFATDNQAQRAADPAGEEQMYPRWQSGQYMHDQFLSHHDQLDNERYAGLQWTGGRAFLGAMLARRNEEIG